MSIAWKAQVTLAFGFRIFVIPVSILHLAYLQSYPTSDEPQFVITRGLILQQVMLALSLISATIPNLKAFMKSFYWGLGFADLERGTISASFDMYELQTIGRRSTREQVTKRATATSSNGGGILPHSRAMLRPDRNQQDVSISHSLAEDMSMPMIDGPIRDKTGSRKMVMKTDTGPGAMLNDTSDLQPFAML